MLTSLSIRDIVLIEALDLDFEPGLNVLTGETGAGKSILLDALGFALGARGRRELLRAGAEKGSVTAVFEIAATHPVQEVLREQDLDASEELVLRRVIDGDGRSRAFVNEQRVGTEALARIGALLVEVHGQHDDRGLLNPRAHRGLLDAFGGLEGQVAEVRTLWAARREAETALDAARRSAEEAARDADWLRHAVAELDELDPDPGEDATLDSRRRLAKEAGKIREEVDRALANITGEGAEGLALDALQRLERVAGAAEGRLDAAVSALDRALVEIGEAEREIAAAAEALSFDPLELDRVEERLFALRGLARKHHVQPDDLAGLADRLRARLADIDGGAERIAALEASLRETAAAYDSAAAALTAARMDAAGRLDAAVTAELAPLRMERAVFRTGISSAEPGPDGTDRVQFTASINPGAPAGPIDRIASGGELSRFLLALKVRLAARSEGLTLIFDEIDRGVGGATADAVGRRLATLAAGAQVLVVTHSPQVAARGAHHWRIEKRVEHRSGAEITRTHVGALAADQRVDEIARMLAGETISEEARSAARVLIEAVD